MQSRNAPLLLLAAAASVSAQATTTAGGLFSVAFPSSLASEQGFNSAQSAALSSAISIEAPIASSALANPTYTALLSDLGTSIASELSKVSATPSLITGTLGAQIQSDVQTALPNLPSSDLAFLTQVASAEFNAATSVLASINAAPASGPHGSGLVLACGAAAGAAVLAGAVLL